jgi:hypothetical protein
MNGKTVIINDKERAVSDDINKAQAYLNEQRQAALRGLLSHQMDDAFVGGECGLVASAGAAYLPAEVFAGLMVQCDAPGYVTVTPGVLGAYVPGLAGADDSPYCVVSDPGMTDITQLLFVVNAGAGPRIDVIECRVVADTTVTSLRDIGDPVTRLYTPTVVPKYAAMKLEYRVRNGVAGGACPAADPDWLPLAVAVVLVGALGYSTCDFYDVRPLVSDRVAYQQRGLSVSAVALLRDRHVGATAVAGASIGVVGYAWSEFEGYVAGGNIWRNSAIAVTAARFGFSMAYDSGEATFLPISAETEALAWAPAAYEVVQVAAVFPGLNDAAHPLPRWKRYSQTGPRVPTGPNGILLLHTTNVTYGLNTGSTVTLPATMQGLGTAGGTVLGNVKLNAAATAIVPAAAAGRMTCTAEVTASVSASVLSAPGAPQIITFPLNPGIDRYPSEARRIKVAVTWTQEIGGGGFDYLNYIVRLYDATDTYQYAILHRGRMYVAMPGPANMGGVNFVCEVPIVPSRGLTSGTLPAALKLHVDVFSLGASFVNAVLANHRLEYLGWE